MANKDVALIGGGFENTAILYSLVEKYTAEKFQNKLSRLTIRLYDIRKDFISGGEAYAASGPEMNFNNTLPVGKDAPKDSRNLYHRFSNWLIDEKAKWLGNLEELAKKNETVARWLEANRDNIEANKFNDLHMKRIVFGQFMRGILDETLTRARQAGIAVALIEGEVQDIDRDAGGNFKLALKPGSRKVKIEANGNDFVFKTGEQHVENLITSDVVLGLGLPPRQPFPLLEKEKNYFKTHLTREGDEKDRPEIIRERVLEEYEKFTDAEKAAGKKVMIGAIGTNTAFADLIPMLDDQRLVGKFELVGFSKKGRIPISHKTDRNIPKDDAWHLYYPDETAIDFPNTQELLAAIERQLADSEKAGYTRAELFKLYSDYYKEISERDGFKDTQIFKEFNSEFVSKLLGILNITEPGVAASADRLLADNALKIINQRLQQEDIRAEDGHFKINISGEQQDFHLIVNVSGKQHALAIPLVRNLVDKELVQVLHGSKYDFELDANNQTTPNMYVGGALSGRTGIKDCIEDAERITDKIYEELKQSPETQPAKEYERG